MRSRRPWALCLTSGGQFSPPRGCFPQHNLHNLPSKFFFLSWNTRTLCSRDRVMTARTLARLRPLTHSHQIICLQEAHGTPHEIRAILVEFEPKFHIFTCTLPDRSSGGVVCLVSRELVLYKTHVRVHELAPGRILALDIWHATADCLLSIVNVHNHDLSLSQLQLLSDWLLPRLQNASSDPQNKMV